MITYDVILLASYAQLQQTGIIDIILKLLDESALAGLAGFSIYMLNQVWKDRLASAERHATEMATLEKEAIEVIKNNTAVMTRLTERLRDFEDV
jgi:hypothetical protein